MRRAALLLLLMASCTGNGGGDPAPAGSVSVATINLHNFPASALADEGVVALIDARELDLLAVQEIDDGATFDALTTSIGGFDSVLSPPQGGTFEQRLGFLWRTDRVSVTDVVVLFDADADFPRPALQARVDSGASDFTVIVVHLKAGTTALDEQQRERQVADLEAHVRAQVDGPEDDEIVILGDYNTAPGDAMGAQVIAPFLGDTTRYSMPTWAIAVAGGVTYLPSGVMLDHVVATAPMVLGTSTAIVRMDQSIPSWETDVSDHLPIAFRVDF